MTMELPEIEAVVGKLYLAVMDLSNQNNQLLGIIDKMQELGAVPEGEAQELTYEEIKERTRKEAEASLPL